MLFFAVVPAVPCAVAKAASLGFVAPLATSLNLSIFAPMACAPSVTAERTELNPVASVLSDAVPVGAANSIDLVVLLVVSVAPVAGRSVRPPVPGVPEALHPEVGNVVLRYLAHPSASSGPEVMIRPSVVGADPSCS